MKLFEFCEKSKEDRRTYEQARMEALQMRKSNAADYINEHNRQIKEKIQILKDQITAKE